MEIGKILEQVLYVTRSEKSVPVFFETRSPRPNFRALDFGAKLAPEAVALFSPLRALQEHSTQVRIRIGLIAENRLGA